jgi:hypothetical protein
MQLGRTSPDIMRRDEFTRAMMDHTPIGKRNMATTGGWLSAAGALVDPGALLLLIAANATPVLVARLFGTRFAAPIDALFKQSSERPLFGAHKTWRGLAAGALASALVGALLPCGVWVGLAFGLLALCGDLASSFVKRRMRFPSGHSAPLLDQLPESLLPLIAFDGALALTGAAVFGTALVFTVLDLATVKWREETGRV